MWHEFSIRIYDKKLDDMGVRSEDESRAYVCLDTIVRFYETLDDSKERKTMILFNDGDSMEVAESYKEVKKLIDANR